MAGAGEGPPGDGEGDVLEAQGGVDRDGAGGDVGGGGGGEVVAGCDGELPGGDGEVPGVGEEPVGEVGAVVGDGDGAVVGDGAVDEAVPGGALVELEGAVVGEGPGGERECGGVAASGAFQAEGAVVGEAGGGDVGVAEGGGAADPGGEAGGDGAVEAAGAAVAAEFDGAGGAARDRGLGAQALQVVRTGEVPTGDVQGGVLDPEAAFDRRRAGRLREGHRGEVQVGPRFHRDAPGVSEGRRRREPGWVVADLDGAGRRVDDVAVEDLAFPGAARAHAEHAVVAELARHGEVRREGAPGALEEERPLVVQGHGSGEGVGDCQGGEAPGERTGDPQGGRR